MRISFATVLSAFFAAGACNQALAQTWNAASDFSATSNPVSQWSYGWSTSVSGPMTLFTYTASNDGGLDSWYRGAPCISHGCLETFPAILHNNTEQTLFLGGHPGSAVAPGVLIMHPGPNETNAVLRWTCPRAGWYQFSANFAGNSSACGTSSSTGDVHVLRNGTEMYAAVVAGHGAAASTDLAFPVEAGGQVDFVVGNGPGDIIGCDHIAVGILVERIGDAPWCEEYVTIDLSSFANARIQGYQPGAAAYPEGKVILGEVPFDIQMVGGNNAWNAAEVSGSPPHVLDVPIGVYGATQVHTLINTYYGQPGPESYISLEFFGSENAYFSKDLIGNVDVRDHFYAWWTNSINDTTTKNVFTTGGGVLEENRLDKQQIILPTSFGNQILTSMRLTSTGGAGISDASIQGLTVVTAQGCGACCFSGADGERTCDTTSDQTSCMALAFVCDVADHLPASFTACFGDVDGNGVVNAGDRGFIPANVDQTAPELICQFDLDGNGFINAGDRGFVSANVGLCTALPDWQNGSGLNHGLPDTRFPAPTFMGAGTTCAESACP